jgi:drug/metabolite transporter (DMT)-like permease
MVLTGLLFVGMTAIVKHVGSDVPAAQSAFLRFALGLPFVVPMLWPLRRARLTGGQARLFAARGVVHTVGVLCWFYAMTRIPLAEVTAMNYLNPIYVTLGAALFLGERWEARRLLAVAAALVGATVVVGMLSATVTLGLLPFAVAVWVPVGWIEVAWFFGTAVLATAAHYTMTRAFAAAPISATQPATFLQLVWSVLLGAALFGEAVDGWVILGGAIIMAAVSFITWREAVARRVETVAEP